MAFLVAGGNNQRYNGVMQRPFLWEHWHKGLMAAFATWVVVFLVTGSLSSLSVTVAMIVASTISAGILLAVLTHYQGFSIDLVKQRFRNFVWVAGLRFGDWRPLPKIVQVKVRAVQRKHHLPTETYPIELGAVATEHVWQVLLNVERSQIGIIAAHTKKSNALRIADELAALLNTKVNVES
ncbi:hypothetical protein GCM10027048_12600 [Hymenobacter coalescens]